MSNMYNYTDEIRQDRTKCYFFFTIEELMAMIEDIKKEDQEHKTMITKEQVEAAERRIAEAEKLIEADKELLAQYNEQISQNLHEELSDILNRCNFMGFPNIVVNEVIANVDANLTYTSDHWRFTIELQCTSFNG